MDKDNSSLTSELRSLTKGLTYQSESDFPVKPFFMEGGGRKSLKASDLPIRARPVKHVDFDDFFRNATKDEEWHGPDEREAASRFRDLVSTLKENLTGLKVYKAGKVEMEVFVVGRTADGDFAGVTTKVVET